MSERIKKLIKPMIVIATFVFVTCCLIKKPVIFEDCSAYLGYAISIVGILFVVYERVLWRFISWNRPPILKNNYDGVISYVYKKQPSTKDIKISVKQTWTTIEITTKTDINASYTITGTIVNEYGVDVLYYTYVTEPSAIHQGENPIQYGTCRIVLDGKNENIKGKYWTSSQTIGDIEWTAISQKS